jgi:hypothetical protein
MAERPRQQPTLLGSSRPSRSPSSSSPYRPVYSSCYSLRTAATARSRGGPAGLGPCLGSSLGSGLGSPSSRSPSPSGTSAAVSNRASPSGQRLSPEPWNPWAPRPRSSHGTGPHSPTVRGREHARPASPLGSSGGGGSLGSRPTSPIDLMNPAPYVPEARPSTSHGRLNGRSDAGVGGGIVFGARRQSAACGPPTSPVAMSNSRANNGSRIQGIQGTAALQQPTPLDGSYGAWGGLSDSPMSDMLDDMPDSLSSSSTPPPQQQPRPQQQQNRETHSPQQSHSQQQNRETQSPPPPSSSPPPPQQQQSHHHHQQSQQRGVANRMSPVMFSTKPSGSTTDLVLETQRRKLLQPLAMGSSGIYEVRLRARVCSTTCGMCVLRWCVNMSMCARV